jgi:hypothetical protein
LPEKDGNHDHYDMSDYSTKTLMLSMALVNADQPFTVPASIFVRLGSSSVLNTCFFRPGYFRAGVPCLIRSVQAIVAICIMVMRRELPPKTPLSIVSSSKEA